jgi:NADH:ubiquinone oxidoreductase subunit C
MISQADLGWQCLSPDIHSLVHLLNEAGIPTETPNTLQGRVRHVVIDPVFWRKAAAVAAANRIRWCAVWGEHCPPEIHIFSTLAGRDGHLLLQTIVADRLAELPSQTPIFPAANRLERYVQDMFGVRFTDHPDQRRWMRHQAWREDQYPLLKTFPLAGIPQSMTPPDSHYPFVPVEGEGVYEIPVGPVHAGIKIGRASCRERVS